jgi:hypothetical protein
MRTKPTTCVSVAITSVIFLSMSSAASAQLCQPHWNTTAPLVGDPGLDGPVYAMTVFDDGTGTALYAAGIFPTGASSSSNGVAKWDGSTWTPIGNGQFYGDWVNTLAVFDDGTGPALYAGGLIKSIGGVFTNAIAKWDGSKWSRLGSGSGIRSPHNSSTVLSLAVFDDGSGPALYVGGNFVHAGGLVANNIAKWDGSTWSTLDNGIPGFVTALGVFDDGAGPALYAGGLLFDNSGTPTNGIVKWDGSSFATVGGGMTGTIAVPRVLDFEVFDDGSRPALYAGGLFTTAGGVEASSIAKWDGSTWSALGNVVNRFRLYALTVFDDGSGPALYAGGERISSGDTVNNSIARWDGSSWSAMGTGINGSGALLSLQVNALTVFDDGTGPSLFTGGIFLEAGGATSNFIAEWTGCADIVPGDVNGDSLVNGADLASLLTGWGACPPSGACPDDLNKDGFVNAADLATVLANWSP